MNKFAMVGCVMLTSWAAISLTSPASSDLRQPHEDDALVVTSYVDYISAIALNFESLADQLERVEDPQSATNACHNVRRVMTHFESLLDRMAQLPPVAPDEARRIQEVFDSGLRSRLDGGMQRFIDAVVRATEKAGGAPEMQTLAAEFRTLSDRIEDALRKI